MAATLQVTSYKNNIPNNDLSVTINESGCTIGRGSGNNFVLPDVERIISQQHATVEFENGAYYLIDNSTNGTFINHSAEPIGQGKKVRLQDGDILSMGKYNCAISIAQQNKPVADSLLDKPMWQPPLHPEVENEPSSWEEPYRKAPIPPSSNAISGLGMEQDYFRPPEAIPEDWDMTGYKLDIESDITFDAPKPIKPKPVKKVQAAPPQPVRDKINREKQAQFSPSVSPDVSPAAMPRLKAKRAEKTNTSNLDQQAIDAFLSGAGLNQVTLEPEAIIGFMHTAGLMMREITQGFRQILDARTSIKGEFRLGMTTIRPIENNPLKFSVDVEDALTKLLLPPSKGYLPPIDAIHEATDDIQAHQMALLAGLRAALSSLVALFNPETIEKDIKKVSSVDNLLPFVRNAKYWEMFKSRYKTAAADAENDFLHILGDEFAIAYEQQIQRLKNARQNNDL